MEKGGRVMVDDGFSNDPYVHNHRPRPARQPKAGELLFEFYRASDHKWFRCELRDHGEWGVEAQLFHSPTFKPATCTGWTSPRTTPSVENNTKTGRT